MKLSPTEIMIHIKITHAHIHTPNKTPSTYTTYTMYIQYISIHTKLQVEKN